MNSVFNSLTAGRNYSKMNRTRMGNRLSLKSSSSLRCIRLLYRLADLRAVKPRSQLQLTVSGSQRPQKLQLELLTTHSRIFKRKKTKHYREDIFMNCTHKQVYTLLRNTIVSKDPLGFALCPPTHANFTITHLNYTTSSAIKLESFYENSFF